MMDEIIRYLKKSIMLMLLSPLKIFPIRKNQIILDNCLAHNYADNIKPIAEYFINKYPGKFQIYLSVLDPRKYEFLRVKGINPIKFHSLEYYKIAMTSAFFITNSGGYSYLPLKKSQIVVNTWHGGGAYKKIGRDAYSADKFYQRELRLASKKTSLFMSTGSMFSDIISNALMIPKNVFKEVGMPRNDILVQGDKELRDKIRVHLGIKDGEKVILFAPTYRKPNDNTFGKSIAINYGIDADRVCDALNRRFGHEWIFAYRLHPQIKGTISFRGKRTLDLSAYDDMQELLLVADAMINDFSSSMWDFMLTGNPCFLFAVDLLHYIDTTAVYVPVNEWPFSKATTNEELEQNIISFDEKEYAEKCKKYYQKLGGSETGKATQFVCEYILSILESEA